jgi:hypothetical protein
MALLLASEEGILNSFFGNCIGCVRTTIAAAATAQTVINTGSIATAGASGNMDATPANNTIVFIGTPGSGATQNQYTAPHAFLVTSSTATVMTIASQSVGLAVTAGDFIWQLGLSTAPLAFAPQTFVNNWYIGLSTQLTSGATFTNIASGEPTFANGYARIIVPNNVANFAAATGSLPATKTNVLTLTMAVASTGAYSTGATTLKSWFAAITPQGGAATDILCIGDLTTPQACNASGITPQFSPGAWTSTLQ